MLDSYPNLESFSAQQLEKLREDAVDWAHANGMVMRTSTMKDRSDLCQSAPFTLFPTPFPRELFDEAMNVQEAMNLLYFYISWDFDFLVRAHCEVIKTDNFTKHMVDILKKVHDEGIKQTKTLLTQRADYMLHKTDGNLTLRQIEVNNIAVSMGSLSERVTVLHKRVLQDVGLSNEVISKAIPDNKPVDTIAKGLFQAWSDFKDETAVILFVVEDANQNQIDQRHIEYKVDELSGRGAKCLRLTLTECGKRLSLGGTDGFSLLLDKKIRVAIVYFRAGYTPDHYVSEFEWEARLLIERSTAIKCPWIGLQLANTKKVQQILTCKGEVERFLSFDPASCKKIRNTFAKMWGFEKDDAVNRDIVKEAVAHPEHFVLKPQLEGGAGNYYCSEVAEMLQKLSFEERAAHILMERIYPNAVKNVLIRAEQMTEVTKTIGELGIYGYLYGDGSFGSSSAKTVHTNYAHGHIIRTKLEAENRGGVAVGAAVIDSVFLF